MLPSVVKKGLELFISFRIRSGLRDHHCWRTQSWNIDHAKACEFPDYLWATAHFSSRKTQVSKYMACELPVFLIDLHKARTSSILQQAVFGSKNDYKASMPCSSYVYSPDVLTLWLPATFRNVAPLVRLILSLQSCSVAMAHKISRNGMIIHIFKCWFFQFLNMMKEWLDTRRSLIDKDYHAAFWTGGRSLLLDEDGGIDN